MIIYGIIPARSQSSRIKNKNIKKLCGKELFLHSINFAKKLKFISKIVFSTDSDFYIKKIANFNKLIIHKRSRRASSGTAMEEDILKDLIKNFNKRNIPLPDGIVWLRPTSPLRSVETFYKAYKIFKKMKRTVMIVHKEESRLFKNINNSLVPIQKKMLKKSMLRSQDCKPLYSIFSGEFFILNSKITKNYLGKKKLFVVSSKYTNFDIDTKQDFKILNNTIKANKKIFKNFIHV